MESFYAQSMPFEADVGWEELVTSQKLTHTEQSHLLFDKPGRFRFTRKNGSFTQVDGGHLTSFDHVTKQIVARSVAPDHCPVALAFAMEPGSIAKHMSVSRFDGVGLNAPGIDVLLATPRLPHRSVAKLLLYVRPSGEVPRVLVMPPTGDRVRLDFTNLLPNVRSPSSLAVPAGHVAAAPPSAPGAPQGVLVATIP